MICVHVQYGTDGKQEAARIDNVTICEPPDDEPCNRDRGRAVTPAVLPRQEPSPTPSVPSHRAN